MRRTPGFSLVELMIVVAIIGILAAIAIPNFVGMQLRAKRTEVPTNVDGVKTSEQAYDAAYDQFVACSVLPRSDGALDKDPATWVSDTNWTTLGWLPDGQVRGNYFVTVSGTTTSTADFTVTGKADVDNDGAVAHFTATNSLNALQLTENDVY